MRIERLQTDGEQVSFGQGILQSIQANTSCLFTQQHKAVSIGGYPVIPLYQLVEIIHMRLLKLTPTLPIKREHVEVLLAQHRKSGIN